ncbi:MAG: polysaccharide deacetylase family protein [Rhodospirillaceae bacterium]|jgi:poly-beta-1,6-N-acetyl-D-glucosamine N-deacetylase|nr:polysaccharide deacetylase family protein [Rhodospirillaceae bacterium]MBT3927091.1 polysaccharide deacetylase family protein [Rhodospirillaceae bacterium]MBT4428363.1 polysaccharide deacetylase family protein [Rhodospirillaceae bacterium]MBT5038824.1 polysaccharide deacetylase family protein [Rhodospirillaceae bacterium]MBT5780635.1 polysaccharide deacetylase family protein [Rhodospirillaceae bacterium]
MMTLLKFIPPLQLRRLKLALAAILLAAFGLPASGMAADSAVILQYHRFGESDMSPTNVTLEQFEAHLEYLQSGGYTVLPVPHIIAALSAGQPLPDKTVGITIDDAVKSVIDEAWPRLRAAGFPFTLFVATDAVDHHQARIMSWDDIRSLVNAGVTIANHSSTHGHLWRGDIAAARHDIEAAQARFQAELGFRPRLFAYPYGEYNLALRGLVEELGFDVAFAQSSGVASNSADFFALPRFSLNEAYGDIKRFRLIIDTLPIPIHDLTPADPVLQQNPPHIGFTVDDSVGDIKRIACYASNQGAVQLELLGASRVELRVPKPFPRGRSRVNCTLPGPDNRWLWFGMQYLVP